MLAFPVISVKVPIPKSTVTLPSIVGVMSAVHEMLSPVSKLEGVPLLTAKSEMSRLVTASEKVNVIWKGESLVVETGPVMLETVGGVVSRTPAKATPCVAVIQSELSILTPKVPSSPASPSALSVVVPAPSLNG